MELGAQTRNEYITGKADSNSGILKKRIFKYRLARSMVVANECWRLNATYKVM